MVIEKVLLIDDEELLLRYMGDILQKNGFEVDAFTEGKKAIKALQEKPYDLVITDMKLKDCHGIEIINQAKKLSPLSLILVVTGYGTIENAVDAMKAGAFHYLLKPFSQSVFETILQKAKETRKLLIQNEFYKNEIPISNSLYKERLIAESSVMKKILENAKKVALSDANVFINGESGTGKEIVAHFIHNHSKRAKNPYIRVNCAAFADTLIESEFFGYEPHAFTGASRHKKLGRFELADSGTLLLDEITETSPALQAKLLRAVQEKSFERVGGTKSIHVNIRLISTSNQNMKYALEKQKIRHDLFLRLNVIPIYLPPLRERIEDILPFAEYFIDKFCFENHKKGLTLSSRAKNALMKHSWPGNVRELSNLIERTVVLGSEDSLFHDLSSTHDNNYMSASAEDDIMTSLPKDLTLKELEKRYIIETLKVESSRKNAASKLGITTRTLRNKLQEYRSDATH